MRKRMRQVLDVPETGPALRRFYVNTTFDSTFVMLGILIGSAFSGNPDLRVVIVTIVTSSVALGISTGVSVFEAETMEQSLRLREIEKALLVSLEETEISKIARWSAFIIAAVNFSAPIITGILILAPFLMMPGGNVRDTAWISVGLAITILFVTGAVMGRSCDRSPISQGARMAVAGIAAFIICFWIESII